MVNVILLFFNRNDAMKIRNLLVKGGHNITDICTSASTVQMCIDRLDGSDGIVVAGFRYRDTTYKELYASLPENFRLVVMASRENLDKIEEADIVKVEMPVKALELHRLLLDLEHEVEQERRIRKSRPKHRSPEEEQTINQAKELLMSLRGIEEPEAHSALLSSSMNNSVELTKVARLLLDLFPETDDSPDNRQNNSE